MELWNDEIERKVIGAAFCGQEVADLVFSEVKGSDFFRPDHRAVFERAKALYDHGSQMDETLVLDLTSEQRAVLGKAIFDATPASAEGQINRLRSLSLTRTIDKLADALKDGIKKSDPEKVLGGLQRNIDKIQGRLGGLSGIPEDTHALAAPIAEEALNGTSRLYSGMSCLVGGGEIDALTDGFQRPEYCIIAARTSVGKTSIVSAIARGVRAANPDAGVPLIATTEMSSGAMAAKELAAAAGVHPRALRKRNLTSEQRSAVKSVIERRLLENVRVVEVGGYSISQLRLLADQHRRRHGLPLLVVDLAAQLKHEGGSERESLAAISGGLRGISLKLGCCVIACVQLSRSLFADGNRRPELHHLKGSGSYEEDADRVLFVHRPGYFGDTTDDTTEIIQAKDRFYGHIGSAFIRYDKWTGRYESVKEKK